MERNKFSLAALAISALILSGCVREEVSPSLTISGRYALDDGTGLSDTFLAFEAGKVCRYRTMSPSPTFAEGYYWYISEGDFSLDGSYTYSFVNGFLDAGGIWQGPAGFKDGALYLGNIRYAEMEGFKEGKRYSTIAPEQSMVTLPYQAAATELKVEVVRPIKSAVLSARTSDSWITYSKISDGKLSFGVTETKIDRSGSITLSYTNADDVVVSVKQAASTYIVLPEKDRTVEYKSGGYIIAYSIDNPVAASSLKVSCSQSWVRDITVGKDNISYSVDENTGKSVRTATFTLSYSGAADITYTLTQNWATTTITTDPASASTSYTGGPASFTYSVKNPRAGVTMTAKSEVDWITDVNLSDNTVSYTVAENNSDTSREGSITLTYASTTETFASYAFIVKQDGNPEKPVDLSANGTANCYIVPKAGWYKFKATVKGGGSESVGTPESADLLWESYGTSEKPSVKSIIASLSYSNGYVIFSTPGTLKNGNAVIAVKNFSGTILWSWHIWVCRDFDPDATAQVYNNNAGTMMDRNLGATSATKGDVKALGLLYQWGRKDPFLGSSSISGSAEAASTITWPSPVESTNSTGTIDYAVKNPTTFIYRNGKNFDWYFTDKNSTDDTRWRSEKDVYDPCPPGWEVPDGGSSGVWTTAFEADRFWVSPSDWDLTDKGMDFGATEKKLGSGVVWYPAAGYRSDVTGTFEGTGTDGYYWCGGTNGRFAYSLFFNADGKVDPLFSNSHRASAHAVRCIKI